MAGQRPWPLCSQVDSSLSCLMPPLSCPQPAPLGLTPALPRGFRGLRLSPRDGALWPTPGLTLFPLSTPAGLVQPLVLSTPADTIGPALTGHPRSVHFFSQPFFLSKPCQETRASLHFCPLSSSLQVSYQRVLKRQPEWLVHAGSSVSQEHRSLITPLPCARSDPRPLTTSCQPGFLPVRPSLSSSPCACCPR